MLLHVCAIRDAKTETFSHPMTFVTKGVAIRSFYDEVIRSGSEVGKHPEDYSLFYLGRYDDQLGTFEVGVQPTQIALALDAKSVN